MTATAGKVQGDLRQGYRTIFGKLLNLVRINSHHMRAQVARETFRIAHRAFGNARHMAINAVYPDIIVTGFVPCFCKMAIFTICANRRQSRFAQLHNACMWVVADNTVERNVFALEQLFVLLVVLDETIGGIYFFNGPARMARAAGFCIAVNSYPDGNGVFGMLTTGSVALFTLNAPGGQVPTSPGKPSWLPMGL